LIIEVVSGQLSVLSDSHRELAAVFFKFVVLHGATFLELARGGGSSLRRGRKENWRS
jgi:hypothetical protein